VNTSRRSVMARLTERITWSGLTSSASSPTSSVPSATRTTEGSQLVARPSGSTAAGSETRWWPCRSPRPPCRPPHSPMCTRSRRRDHDLCPCRSVQPLSRHARYSPAGGR
jgi:hypothetical protein